MPETSDIEDTGTQRERLHIRHQRVDGYRNSRQPDVQEYPEILFRGRIPIKGLYLHAGPFPQPGQPRQRFRWKNTILSTAAFSVACSEYWESNQGRDRQARRRRRAGARRTTQADIWHIFAGIQWNRPRLFHCLYVPVVHSDRVSSGVETCSAVR